MLLLKITNEKLTNTTEIKSEKNEMKKIRNRLLFVDNRDIKKTIVIETNDLSKSKNDIFFFNMM